MEKENAAKNAALERDKTRFLKAHGKDEELKAMMEQFRNARALEEVKRSFRSLQVWVLFISIYLFFDLFSHFLFSVVERKRVAREREKSRRETKGKYWGFKENQS